MELTPEQTTYIQTTVAARGSNFNPNYTFELCQTKPGNRLQIHVNTTTGHHIIGGARSRDDWSNEEVFHVLVDEAMDDVEKTITRETT